MFTYSNTHEILCIHLLCEQELLFSVNDTKHNLLDIANIKVIVGCEFPIKEETHTHYAMPFYKCHILFLLTLVMYVCICVV